MSSLYDQLSKSGGVPKKAHETNSTYHTPSYQSSSPGGNLTSYQKAVEQKRREREQQMSSWKKRSGSPAARVPQRSTQQTQPKWSYATDYMPLTTDRPYAYVPAKADIGPPKLWDIFLDFGVFLAESLLVAAGHALVQFFMHSRVRPSIGMRH
jgi:hypothetical protein